VRELSIFIDESGDFGPHEKHSPFYLVGLVFHDQSDSIAGHLDGVHDGLVARGLPVDHAIHAGPLIRREQEYRWMAVPARRAIFRLLMDFVHRCEIRQHSLVFSKREVGDVDRLVSLMSRQMGALIRDHYEYFSSWDRIVIYYDNGQKELTNIVNSAFSSQLSTVEVRKVAPSDYSLFQAADLCCTLELLRTKIGSGGLSSSERDFFATEKRSAEQALRRLYFKTLDRKRFGS
jgi:hypothetical protein